MGELYRDQGHRRHDCGQGKHGRDKGKAHTFESARREAGCSAC
jgi:hypothetical protein